MADIAVYLASAIQGCIAFINTMVRVKYVVAKTKHALNIKNAYAVISQMRLLSRVYSIRLQYPSITFNSSENVYCHYQLEAVIASQVQHHFLQWYACTYLQTIENSTAQYADTEYPWYCHSEIFEVKIFQDC